MSHSNSSLSDLPPSPLPQHIPSLLPVHGDCPTSPYPRAARFCHTKSSHRWGAWAKERERRDRSILPMVWLEAWARARTHKFVRISSCHWKKIAQVRESSHEAQLKRRRRQRRHVTAHNSFNALICDDVEEQRHVEATKGTKMDVEAVHEFWAFACIRSHVTETRSSRVHRGNSQAWRTYVKMCTQGTTEGRSPLMGSKELHMIIKVQPENIRNTHVGAEWQELGFVVDSRASETVIGEGKSSDMSDPRRCSQPQRSASWNSQWTENRQSGCAVTWMQTQTMEPRDARQQSLRSKQGLCYQFAEWRSQGTRLYSVKMEVTWSMTEQARACSCKTKLDFSCWKKCEALGFFFCGRQHRSRWHVRKRGAQGQRSART